MKTDDRTIILEKPGIRLTVPAERCDGRYVDFQGGDRACLPGGEGCGCEGCPAAHGPSGGW